MLLKELVSKRRMHELFKDITKGAVVYDGSHKAHYLFTGNLPVNEILPLTNLMPPPNAFYYFYCYRGVKRQEWLMWAGMGKQGEADRIIMHTWYVKPPHIVDAVGHEPDWSFYIPVDEKAAPQLKEKYELRVMPEFKLVIDRAPKNGLDAFYEEANVKTGLLMWMLDAHNKLAAGDEKIAWKHNLSLANRYEEWLEEGLDEREEIER